MKIINMKMFSSRHILKLGFILLYLFSIMIIDTLFRVQLSDQGKEKLRWVEHTNNVIIEMKEYLGALKDTETGQRGYLLTRDKDYLEPYYDGIDQAKQSYEKLFDLTSDNINQTKRLEKISILMELKFNELRTTIEIKAEDALSLVKQNVGKQYMDEIRSILKEFILEERSLLEIRKVELQALNKSHLLIVRLISFSLLFIIVYVLYINLNQKNKLKSALLEITKKNHLMLEQSRLAQMGEMISMIAHQWRQPLGAISATNIDLKMKIELEIFDLALEDEREASKEYFNQGLSKIEELTQSLTSTIEDFKNFYKSNKAHSEVNINEPIKKALNIIETSLGMDEIEVKKSFQSKKILQLLDNEMMQVLLNIFKNSQDNFKIRDIKNPIIYINTLDTKKGATIYIEDNGGGIAKGVIDKIFDPYFSTKSEKNGTGLGLYMSKMIVEDHHNASLHVENTDDGVLFKISLLDTQKD